MNVNRENCSVSIRKRATRLPRRQSLRVHVDNVHATDLPEIGLSLVTIIDSPQTNPGTIGEWNIIAC